MDSYPLKRHWAVHTIRGLCGGRANRRRLERGMRGEVLVEFDATQCRLRKTEECIQVQLLSQVCWVVLPQAESWKTVVGDAQVCDVRVSGRV